MWLCIACHGNQMSITYNGGEFLWQISRLPPLAPDYRKVRYCQVIRSVFWLFFWHVGTYLHVISVLWNSNGSLSTNGPCWPFNILCILQYLCTGLKPKTGQRTAQIKVVIALNNFHHWQNKQWPDQEFKVKGGYQPECTAGYGSQMQMKAYWLQRK